jgi:hypothetical protein
VVGSLHLDKNHKMLSDQIHSCGIKSRAGRYRVLGRTEGAFLGPIKAHENGDVKSQKGP